MKLLKYQGASIYGLMPNERVVLEELEDVEWVVTAQGHLDSDEIPPELEGVAADDGSFPEGTANFLISVGSVSYTHLDVYKRQPLSRSSTACGGVVDGNCITADGIKAQLRTCSRKASSKSFGQPDRSISAKSEQ